MNMLKPMPARGELVGDRRDDARRVPKAHREGRAGPRAALPADLRRRTVRRRHDRDPPRPQGALRGAPRRPVPDAALVAAAVLSDRYISDRQFPTRRSTSSTRPPRACGMEIDSSPIELDEAERRVRQLEIELPRWARSRRRSGSLSRRAGRGEGAPRTSSPRAGRRRRRRSSASRRSWLGSRSCATRRSAPSAPATSSGSRRSDTASCRSSRRSSPSATAPSIENPMVKEEVDEDDVAVVARALDRSRSTSCSRARPRS